MQYLAKAAICILTHLENPSDQSLCPNLWHVGIVSGKSQERAVMRGVLGLPQWEHADLSLSVLICTAQVISTSPAHCLSMVHHSAGIWTDVLFHLWKNGWNSCSPLFSSLVWRGGAEVQDLQNGFNFQRAFPVFLVHLDPGWGELPSRSGEGSKSRGFAEGSRGAALPCVIQHLHIPRAGNQRLHGLELRVSTFCCQTYKFN